MQGVPGPLIGIVGSLALLVWVVVRELRRPEGAARPARDEWQRLARTLRIGLVLCVILPALVVYAIYTAPFVLLAYQWLRTAP